MLTAFNWIIRGQLAGSGRPGLLSELADDLAFIEDQGIRTIISLTEAPVDSLQRLSSIENLHFPIPDMGFPTPRFAAIICAKALTSMDRGGVLLHCHAGLGRTGTIAACCLVTLGEAPGRALERVRALDSRYVQTRSQEQCVHHYAYFVRERRAV